MKVNLGLLPRIIIAIILGSILGLVGFSPIMVILATYNSLFSSLLSFTIPLIILGFIIPGISDLGKGAGKMLGITIAFSYIVTVLAGFLSYFAVSTFSSLIVDVGSALNIDGAYREPVASLINLDIPPVMNIMTALALAFVIGILVVHVEGDNTIAKFANEFQQIIKMLITKVIIPLLPIHIAGIFASMAYVGQVASMMGTFLRVFILILALHFIFLLILYTIAGVIYKQNPFVFMKKMIPSYLTALGTQSSAATIPVNLIQVKKLGVKNSVAEFVVPLGANIQLSGSTITITSLTIIIMYMYGMEVSFAIILPFIFTVAIAMVAAPGVPGGAVMAALGILELTLGFEQVHLSLIMALYIAQDSLGTACNVTSDGAMSLILNKISGNDTLEEVK